MNEIVSKFLLAGGRFIPEMHLRQPGYTCRACGPFTKNKERIKNFKETGDSRYICQNELVKVVLKIQNVMDIKEVFLQWFTNFLIKHFLVVVSKMKIFLIKN